MAHPQAYNRVTSFTNYQAVNPTVPLPGSTLDQELDAVKVTLDQTLANLELIQRDDGALANLSVGFEQLAEDVQTGMFNRPTVWATSTDYVASVDAVFHGSAFYRAVETHTSGTFATDLAASKWELIIDLSTLTVSTADQVAFTVAGTIAATDVQAAIEELDAEKAALSHSHAATQISDSTAAGRALLTAADAAAQLAALGLSYAAPTYGEIRDTAAISAPAGWLFCYGQAIDRTTYANLFNAITISQSGVRTSGSPIITGLSDTSNMRAGHPASGTGIPSNTTILTVDNSTQITLSQNATTSGTNTVVIAPHGVGNGVSTFNVPDHRDRVRAGRGDMGGSVKGLLTSVHFGSASRLGATGGVQGIALTELELAAHNHVINISESVHHHDNNIYAKSSGFQSGTGVTGVTDVFNSGGFSGNTTSATTGITADSDDAGSGNAHNNVQPTVIENVIIFAGV